MNFEPMKAFMDRLTDWRIPGNAISVYKDGVEVFKYQSGYSDLENKIPTAGNELLYIYSCTKPLTVTAALQLYEKGLFLLDDPLYDFLPEFREMYVKGKDGEMKKAEKPITLRHLFAMTSGLDYSFGGGERKRAYEATGGRMNTREAVKEMANKVLCFEPGEGWMYGLNHDVLACAVEVISGKKFRDYVRENIFEPLDMKSSCFHKEGVEDKIAPLYRFVGSDESDIVKLQSAERLCTSGYIKREPNDNSLVFGPEYDSGGAGIITAVDDYAKFCAALAGFGKGVNGEQILAKGTVELLRTNQLDEHNLKCFSWKQHKGYGYGLGVRTLIDKAQSGSNGNLGEFGWGGAAGATIIADPDGGLAVFYAHHMLNCQEPYYQPRLRNVIYSCF